MSLDRHLLQQVRSLDEHDLRRLLIFTRGLLVQRGHLPLGPEESVGTGPDRVGYRLQRVKCGKPGCTRCPHGPYWYAYWREGGRVRTRYIGRELPADVSP
ncbi:MAG TPA: hypothetical protein VHA57_04450 [Actinomycetota bacterium]|nr:hypothetical protein [Actinomycetota bacterium]